MTMALTQTQIDAERAVHEALDAGDETTLAEFADFAAGEIAGKHIDALLLAILQADADRWAFMLAGIRLHSPDLADAIDKLENELERQRAKFIEAYADFKLEQAGLDEMAKAEINAAFKGFIQ